MTGTGLRGTQGNHNQPPPDWAGQRPNSSFVTHGLLPKDNVSHSTSVQGSSLTAIYDPLQQDSKFRNNYRLFGNVLAYKKKEMTYAGVIKHLEG